MVNGRNDSPDLPNAAPPASPRAPGARAHLCDTLARVGTAIHASRDLAGLSLEALVRAAGRDARAGRAGAPEHGRRASDALRAEAREAVAAYARRLRADAVPPERMVVELKGAVREGTPPELDVAEARELMEDAVRWGIDAYYAG